MDVVKQKKTCYEVSMLIGGDAYYDDIQRQIDELWLICKDLMVPSDSKWIGNLFRKIHIGLDSRHAERINALHAQYVRHVDTKEKLKKLNRPRERPRRERLL